MATVTREYRGTYRCNLSNRDLSALIVFTIGYTLNSVASYVAAWPWRAAAQSFRPVLDALRSILVDTRAQEAEFRAADRQSGLPRLQRRTTFVQF